MPFTIRAEPNTATQLRPLLIKQLQMAGHSTHWHFPVFMCEELQTPAVLPVFLTREGLATTWKALGKAGPPPTQLTVTDLRIVADEMQKSFKESGCDWSIVRFLGSEQGWNAVKEGMEQAEGGAPRPGSPGEDEGWAVSKSSSKGSSQRSSKSDEPKQPPSDPNDAEAEPPELA